MNSRKLAQNLRKFIIYSKLLFLIMLSQLISCDYSDRIEALTDNVSQLQDQVDNLKRAYESGKIITKVEPVTTEQGGWEITFSDNSTINIFSGKDGITPYIKIDVEGYWVVSYDDFKTFTQILDSEGNPISAKGETGKDGVSIDIRINSENNYEIVTYVEDKNNPISVIATPYSAKPENQISSILEDVTQGVVTIKMQNGKEYNFLQKINYPTSIMLINKEYLFTEKGGFVTIEFRVNPSNTVLLKNDILIDCLKLKSQTYADSYVSKSSNYNISDLKKSTNANGEILQGQYMLTVEDSRKQDDYTEICSLVINTKDANGNNIQITSESFTLKRNLNPEQEMAGIEVCMPAELYILQDEKSQIFYRGFIKAVNPYNYDIKVMCDIGKTYPRYYQIDKSVPLGDYPLTIQVRDDNLNILGSATTIIHVIDKPQISAPTNVLCIGASATATGWWSAELERKINNDMISFVGRKTGTKETILLEATGGWSWSNFVSQQSPFVQDGKLNFKNYADKYCNGSIDVIIAHIGVNAALWENNQWMQGEITHAKKIIEGYFAEFPNGKIILSAIPMPDEGTNIYDNSNTENNVNRYGTLLTFLRYNAMLQDLVNTYGATNKIYYAPVNLFFDTDNGYPKGNLDVNDRNDSTTEVVGINGVHPTKEGSYMVADGILPIFYEKIFK